MIVRLIELATLILTFFMTKHVTVGGYFELSCSDRWTTGTISLRDEDIVLIDDVDDMFDKRGIVAVVAVVAVVTSNVM